MQEDKIRFDVLAKVFTDWRRLDTEGRIYELKLLHKSPALNESEVGFVEDLISDLEERRYMN